jgi:hypothetical protein
MSCSGRMRSRLLASCGRLTGLVGRIRFLRLRLRCLIRDSLVLSRTRCSCPVFSGLVLGRLILSRLVLGRAGCSCLSFSCLILGGLVPSGLALGCLILSRARCSCLGFGSPLASLARSRPVRCSRLFGLYHPRTAKLPRLCRGSDCRPPLVHGRQKGMIGAGSLHVLILHRGGPRVSRFLPLRSVER